MITVSLRRDKIRWSLKIKYEKVQQKDWRHVFLTPYDTHFKRLKQIFVYFMLFAKTSPICEILYDFTQ